MFRKLLSVIRNVDKVRNIEESLKNYPEYKQSEEARKRLNEEMNRLHDQMRDENNANY